MTEPAPKGCKVWTTFVPLYRMCIHLVLAKDAKRVVRARSEFNEVFGACEFAWDGEGAMCSWKDHEVGMFFQEEALTHGCIAHEVLHAVARILDVRGLEFDAGNLEGYTYLVEWVTNWVYGRIGKSVARATEEGC